MFKQKGFTLLETVVVVAIIGILLAVTMVRWSSISKNEKLKGETLKVESIVREAQSMSLSPRATDLTSDFEDWGYGIYLSSDNKQFILFKDKKIGNKIKYDSAIDTNIKTYSLSENIKTNVFIKKNDGSTFYLTNASFVFLIGEGVADRSIWFEGQYGALNCSSPNPCSLNNFTQEPQGIAVWYGGNSIEGEYQFIKITKAGVIETYPLTGLP